MSLQMEHRGFTIGRQVGVCGRWTRFVLGLLGLVYIGTQVVHLGLSAVLIERLAGSLLLTTALYIVLFWLLGERVSQPWLRTVIFWLPGARVLWWLRGGGVAQPPLSALFHSLLPAQCHRPDRAPLHAPRKRSGGSGLRSSQGQQAQ